MQLRLIASIYVAVLLTFVSAPRSEAGQPGGDPADDLRAALARVGVGAGTIAPPEGALQQVRFRMHTDEASLAGAAAGRSPHATLARVSRVTSGPLRPPRSFSMSTENLVVVALDSSKRLRGVAVVQDPRLRRLEFADESGALTSNGIEYADEAQLTVTLPNDPAITTIQVYSPRWTGVEYLLDLVDAVEFDARF